MQEQVKNSAQMISTESVATVYSNHVAVTVSFNDFRVYFSEVSPSTVGLEPIAPSEPRALKPSVRPLVSVVMSPEQYKIFAQTIAANLAVYERQFGPIKPLPTPTGTPGQK